MYFIYIESKSYDLIEINIQDNSDIMIKFSIFYYINSVYLTIYDVIIQDSFQKKWVNKINLFIIYN